LRKSSGPASGSSDDDLRQPYGLKAGLAPKDNLLNQSSSRALSLFFFSLYFSYLSCASDRLSYLNLQLLLKRSAIYLTAELLTIRQQQKKKQKQKKNIFLFQPVCVM